MKIVDCHVHMTGEVADAGNLLKVMDANRVERIIVFSKNERTSLERTKQKLADAKTLCDQAPDRISGLAWLEPTIEGMGELAREALTDMGFAGIKIIPDHWFAYEERLEPWWEIMNELEASILFHTGILYSHEDGSRFCRPLYLEKLLYYPKIRFAMAHISWPWCEECLAVMGRMKSAVREGLCSEWQSYVDTTPGTPRHIRKQALANAVDFCGPERLMFGTDCVIPGDLAGQRARIETDSRIYDELGLTAGQKERIFSGTAEELFL